MVSILVIIKEQRYNRRSHRLVKVAKSMFYCVGKHIEKWLRQRSRKGRKLRMPAFGLETEGDTQNEKKHNQDQRNKTIVRRKKGQIKRKGLRWLKHKILTR